MRILSTKPLLLVLIALAVPSQVQAFFVAKSPNIIQERSKNPSSLLKLSATSASEETKQPLWDMEELEDYADRTGVVISFTTLGPGYRAVARAKHDEKLILGYVEGFIRPAGQILHLDKMEIFQPMLKKAKQQVPEAFDFGGISFGVGLVLGYRCLLHAKENGCSIAEFLAIDDEEFQHKRLVRYYKRVGFQVVKYVGDDFQDIPARMVWGGCGTLMKEEIDVLIQKWAGLLALMDERSKKSSTQ